MPTLFPLQGHRIYKLSMGNLGSPKSRELLPEFRKKGWLVIDQHAGNKQGKRFVNLRKGAFVYACVGSWQLWGLYRITGDWHLLPPEMAEKMPNDGRWGYREAELVASPVQHDLKRLAKVRQFWAPSGNSTFFQIKDISAANRLFFEPYFDLTITPDGESLQPVSRKSSPKAHNQVFPLNQILYGPPGTGKTYHTTARAVALLEGISDEELATKYPPEKRAELRQKFEDYRAAGRIGFVTFHQAFTYEDFVEGIKPVLPKQGQKADELEEDVEAETDESNTQLAHPAPGLQYAVRKGIFRQMCDSAAEAVPTPEGEEGIVLTPMPFEELYTGFLDQLDERIKNTDGPVIFRTKEGYGVQLTSVDKQIGRLTFQYGKGRQINPAEQLNDDGSFSHVDKHRQEKLYQLYTSVDQIKNLKRDITDKVRGSAKTLQWVAFNELKKYEATRLTQQQDLLQTKPSPPFVLIIDEINRGNVANIFGELITLLEDDKRAGQPEAASVTLPYSQEEFSVPQNLYLLGTMNTADRSVEALDTALRRRFSFTEMLPDPTLLPTDVEGVNVREMLVAINARLEQLLDHDHCIGHALLMRVTTLDGLREAFRRNILPLLQEYFFGDWGKIGLVLGGAFIQPVNKKQNTGGYTLKKFDTYSVSELSEKAVYKLADVLKLDAKAFQNIYAS